MRRILCIMAGVAAGTLLAGCFTKVSYETTYVLKPLVQTSSSGVLDPLAGTQAFAYHVDTTLWTVASYEDALQGVITSKNDPTERRVSPDAVSEPYSGGLAGEGTTPTAHWLQMRLTRESEMVVVVDPASRTYAYTQQALGKNLPNLYVSLVFRTWKEGNSYKDGNWSFYNEYYAEPVYLDCYIRPEVQTEQDGASAPIASGKVNAYAYDADTTQWCVASYADALAGTITMKENPEQKRSIPAFQAYLEPQTELYRMTVSSPELMIVVVDESSRMYAYTQQEVDLEGSSPTFDVLFRPWMGVWINEEAGWCYVDESLAPSDTDETTAMEQRR